MTALLEIIGLFSIGIFIFIGLGVCRGAAMADRKRDELDLEAGVDLSGQGRGKED